MTIANLMSESEEIRSNTFAFLDRYDTYVESLCNDFTDEDIYSESDKSSEGVFTKIAKATKKIVKQIIETLKSIANSIKEFFTGKENKEFFKKAEELSKTPKGSKAVVKSADINKVTKAYDKGISEIEKKMSAQKAGVFSKDTSKDIEDIVNRTDAEVKQARKEHALKIGAFITMVVGCVGGYMLINKKDSDKMEEKGAEAEKFDDLEKNPGGYAKMLGGLSRIITKKHLELDNFIKTSRSKIKYGFQGMKPTHVPDKSASEYLKKESEDIDINEDEVKGNPENQEDYIKKLLEVVDTENNAEKDEEIMNAINELDNIEEAVALDLLNEELNTIEESVATDIFNEELDAIEESVVDEFCGPELGDTVEESVSVGEALEMLEREIF